MHDEPHVRVCPDSIHRPAPAIVNGYKPNYHRVAFIGQVYLPVGGAIGFPRNTLGINTHGLMNVCNQDSKNSPAGSHAFSHSHRITNSRVHDIEYSRRQMETESRRYSYHSYGIHKVHIFLLSLMNHDTEQK